MLRPTCLLLGFADGLFHVGPGAFFLDRPGSNHCLVKEVLRIAIGELAGFKESVQPRPPAQRSPPRARNLGEDGQARAHVVGAFGVVGGERIHRPRVEHVCSVAEGMEFFEGDSIASRRRAHLVEPDHPIEAIEGGVFHALGHHRRSELLKALDELVFQVPARGEAEDITNEVEQSRFDISPACLGNR